MKKIFTLFFIFFVSSPFLFSKETEPEESEKTIETVAFNPRDDYRFGVGTVVGGPLGVLGLIADMNWYSLINAEIGVGTGLYFDSYSLHGRYLILDNPLTPFLGGGFAYWDATSNGPKMAQNSEIAVKLGLVKADGTQLRGGILIFPLAIGLHYMSDSGLCLFGDLEFLLSPTYSAGIPYGSLGFQWFF